MASRREHPNKGWAATYGRVSLIRAGTDPDSPENQDRLNRRAAPLLGLKVKPGYEFSDHGVSASKPIERRDVERGIKAVVDRRIMADVLRGRSLRSIAIALNEEGIPSPGAVKAIEMRAQWTPTQGANRSQWNTTGLSSMLRNPSLVGWQWHGGKVVLGPDGDPVSFGEGILTPGEHARARRVGAPHGDRSASKTNR